MNPTTILVLLLCVPGQATASDRPAESEAEKARGERLLRIHTDDAASYDIYRDAARTQKLELRREPIYRWTNPTRVGGQIGEVFIWTEHGRPEVIGSIFSHPDGNLRVFCHEFHSLSTEVLVVDRDAPNRWEPQAPGVDLKPIPGAPAPARSAAQRQAQIRELARTFSGRSLSDQGQSWELRLLPRPLYRYESTSTDVIDGALFALVSSAGTDPEIILLLEARRTDSGPQWQFGAARFSDMSLWLKHNNEEVWSAIRGPENTFNHDAKHRFRFFQDRIIPDPLKSSP
jgi:hypothetical protein